MPTWNWQRSNWPQFTFDAEALETAERAYAHLMGTIAGVMLHMEAADTEDIVIRSLCTEGVKTAEIEGELLNRDSVQASIRRKLGLAAPRRSANPAETGMAEMMVTVYRTYDSPLTHEELHEWNAQILQGRTNLEHIGAYRTHEEPMVIVSGALGKEQIHFEAPSSRVVPREMEQFLAWFNETSRMLPPLTRAGIAHLYAVSIHPFEDGNGRMARGITEKALSQAANAPALSGLSLQIAGKKNAYYDALERNNKTLAITDWLLYFTETALAAKKTMLATVEQIIRKNALFRRYSDILNERQKKVLHKLFEAEPEGFVGGLSAGKYMNITKAPHATTTRDLKKLVDLGILMMEGERRHARYRLTE